MSLQATLAASFKYMHVSSSTEHVCYRDLADPSVWMNKMSRRPSLRALSLPQLPRHAREADAELDRKYCIEELHETPRDGDLANFTAAVGPGGRHLITSRYKS